MFRSIERVRWRLGNDLQVSWNALFHLGDVVRRWLLEDAARVISQIRSLHG
jgi:hypothetical protein